MAAGRSSRSCCVRGTRARWSCPPRARHSEFRRRARGHEGRAPHEGHGVAVRVELEPLEKRREQRVQPHEHAHHQPRPRSRQRTGRGRRCRWDPARQPAAGLPWVAQHAAAPHPAVDLPHHVIDEHLQVLGEVAELVGDPEQLPAVHASTGDADRGFEAAPGRSRVPADSRRSPRSVDGLRRGTPTRKRIEQTIERNCCARHLDAFACRWRTTASMGRARRA